MCWKEALADEFRADYMQQLRAFLVERQGQGQVCPPMPQLFAALDSAPLEKVKVVILGQDPYHGPGQAHGLSFSVPSGVAIPPSLKNILQELHRDLQVPLPTHGCLQAWADQGVLLLNSVLSVDLHRPASHSKQGWERFTDATIRILSARGGIVFMLWGAYAKRKAEIIDSDRNLVLFAAHPSPFSVQGFRGCAHFSRCNAWLEEQGQTAIDWRL